MTILDMYNGNGIQWGDNLFLFLFTLVFYNLILYLLKRSKETPPQNNILLVVLLQYQSVPRLKVCDKKSVNVVRQRLPFFLWGYWRISFKRLH